MSFAELTFLGQAGAILRWDHCGICLDPYLTDSVAEKHGDRYRRMVPPPMTPLECTAINWVLLTHVHDDHTDLATLIPLLAVNPMAKVMAPPPCRRLLQDAGIAKTRLYQPTPGWFSLEPGIFVRAIPAAHPQLEVDERGESLCVGYLIRHTGGTLYHSGDTSSHSHIFSEFDTEPGLDWALIPFNERNYFRDEQGIVGNMSVREALEFADRIGARRVIPIHWDMFAPNSTSVEEIELIHRLESRRFEMHLIRSGQSVRLINSPAE